MKRYGMETGWIKLWRKSIDSQVFQDAELWKMWSWCLMKATHKRFWIPVRTGRGDTQVELLPGQFIFGRFEAAKELKMKPSSVNYRIHRLSRIGNIDIKVDTHFSIISIVNWGSYQSDNDISEQATEHPTNTQLTPNEHPTNTNKNVKNVKNIKNKDIYKGLFLEFWEKYPNKRNKKGAYLEWEKSRKDSILPGIEIILEQLKKQINYKVYLLQNNKFCPEWSDPERWIKNRRWEDEPETKMFETSSAKQLDDLEKMEIKHGHTEPS